MPILPYRPTPLPIDRVVIVMQPIRCAGHITAWRFFARVDGEVSLSLIIELGNIKFRIVIHHF